MNELDSFVQIRITYDRALLNAAEIVKFSLLKILHDKNQMLSDSVMQNNFILAYP